MNDNKKLTWGGDFSRVSKPFFACEIKRTGEKLLFFLVPRKEGKKK